jgi:hypothetical protein
MILAASRTIAVGAQLGLASVLPAGRNDWPGTQQALRTTDAVIPEAYLAFVANNVGGLATVRFDSGSYPVEEEAGMVEVMITLNAITEKTVTVTVSTSNGTALSRSDYVSTRTMLSFAPGEMTKMISVVVNDDQLDESDETFYVTLSRPVNAVLGTCSTTAVTIADDDQPPAIPSRFGLQIAALHQIAPFLSSVQATSAAGVTVAGQWTDARTLDELPYDRLDDALRDSGAGWARVYVDWAQIQPTEPVLGQPPDYQWRWYDDRLRTIAGAGVQLLITVANAPSWAADRGCAPIYPDRLDEFVRFLTDMVNRYKVAPYYARHWEILNEPDFDGSREDMVGKSCWGNDPDRYVQTLAAVYPAIKGADPEATVILGGLAYDFFTEYEGPFVRYFPDEVMENGGASYLDALNIHYFTWFRAEWERWRPEAPPTCGTVDDGEGTPYEAWGIDVIAKAKHFGNRMSVCHRVRKPLWVTEIGFSGQPGNSSSLARQARYVIQGSVRALAAGAEQVTWFALTAPNDPGVYLDLLYDDWAPKPSFRAYQALTSELTGYDYVRALDDPGVEGYVFENASGQQRTVAWGSGTKAFSPAQRVRVVDREGIESFVQDGGAGDADGTQNGSIGLGLSIDPIFVTVIE